MPRYHFDIHEGRDVPDHEGTDLPDVEAARVEAMRFVGELFICEGSRLASNGGCSIVVRDEHDVAQFRLDVAIALEPPFRPGTRR